MQAAARLTLALALLGAAAVSCAPLAPKRTTEVRIARAVSPLSARDTALAGWRFVIDPGHGGRERGAPSPLADHASEADLNLGVALLVGGLLQASGAEVHFTRTADIAVGDSGLPLGRELEARARLSNALRPDLFLSIHHNGSSRPDHNGVEVYYKLRTRGPARDAGRDLLGELGALYPGFDSALLAGNFSVLRNLDHEGILIECAYLSDRALAPRLETVTLIKAEAEAIFRGVRRFALGSETFSRSFRVEPTAPDPTIPPGDTRPRLLVVADSPSLPMLDRLLQGRAETSVVRVERLATTADPSHTLLAIEDSAPQVVVILRAGRPSRMVHYFRSATGERIARAVAERFRGMRVVAGSEYLVTHTSMVALALTIPRIDEPALRKAIEALTREMAAKPTP